MALQCFDNDKKNYKRANEKLNLQNKDTKFVLSKYRNHNKLDSNMQLKCPMSKRHSNWQFKHSRIEVGITIVAMIPQSKSNPEFLDHEQRGAFKGRIPF